MRISNGKGNNTSNETIKTGIEDTNRIYNTIRITIMITALLFAACSVVVVRNRKK